MGPDGLEEPHPSQCSFQKQRGLLALIGVRFKFPAKAHVQVKETSRGEEELLGPDVRFWKLFTASPYQPQLGKARSEFSFLKQQVFDFCSEMATPWLGQTKSFH